MIRLKYHQPHLGIKLPRNANSASPIPMVELRRSTRKVTKPTTQTKPVTKQAKSTKPSKTNTKPTKAKQSKPAMSELEVGDMIPNLTLKDEDDNEINLTEISKKSKYLVIFAYPKALTPGCTRQVCGFQQNFDSLTKLDTTVLGLSADLPKSQKNFITKQGLKYHLLSDPEKALIGPLGAKKEPTGIKRSHWIFENGVLKIKKIQISPEDSFNGALADIELMT